MAESKIQVQQVETLSSADVIAPTGITINKCQIRRYGKVISVSFGLANRSGADITIANNGEVLSGFPVKMSESSISAFDHTHSSFGIFTARNYILITEFVFVFKNGTYLYGGFTTFEA